MEGMTADQVHRFLVWMNQHEPRIEPSPVNVEVWEKVIGQYPADVLKDVLLDYWARTDEKPTPANVRRMVQGEVERRAARQSALAGPRPKNRSERGWSVMREPWFQQKRMEARIAQCEELGLPHDGDGWTAVDRPAGSGTTEGVLGKVEAAY